MSNVLKAYLVKMPEDIHRKLKAYCALHNMTINDAIVLLVDDLVNPKEQFKDSLSVRTTKAP